MCVGFLRSHVGTKEENENPCLRGGLMFVIFRFLSPLSKIHYDLHHIHKGGRSAATPFRCVGFLPVFSEWQCRRVLDDGNSQFGTLHRHHRHVVSQTRA
jgi:hypothetical protein